MLRKRISSKTLSTSSLTINGALIVKDEVDKDFELSLMLTAWIAANVYAYVHGHTRTRGLPINQKNKQERLVVHHAPWLDHDPKINCSNALNFMTSTDAIAAKERICFDHELVRDQNNAFNYTSCIIKIQAIISRKSILGLRLIVI